jgi:hypothetical protein
MNEFAPLDAIRVDDRIRRDEAQGWLMEDAQ